MTSRKTASGETRGARGTDQPTGAPLLWRRVLELGPELGSDWHAVRGHGPQLDPPPEPTAFGEAEVVEGAGRLTIESVGPPAASRFEFFLDGIEHTRVCGYVGVVPLVHGYVATVIRRRQEREFFTWDIIEEEVLAFPHRLLDPARFLDLGFPDHALIDSAGDAEGLHPIRLAEDGRGAVKLHRALLERKLARRWADAQPGEGWLLIDGRLAIEPALLRSGRAIGLVKSHRTQFLPPEAMAAVLGMARGHRSTVFKPVRPDVGAVYSWYLRLRPPSGHDIYWALARIEARADPESIERADEVSRWLLDETAPLALPDPRWHVMPYPIRDCEQFLRARMPTLEIR